MKKLSVIFILIFVSSLTITSIAQEIQVPFFPEQGIITLDKSFAKKLTFFDNYDKFIEAKMFLTRDAQYAIEVYYEKNDTIFKDRRLLNFEEKDAYLEKLVKEYAETLNQEVGSGSSELAVLDQRGRSVMLIMNTAVGLGFYGWAIPTALNIEEDKAFIGMYMLTAGASFYLPYRYSRDKQVTLAQSSLKFYGQSRGAMHGIFLAELLSKEPDYPDPYSEPAYTVYRDAQDKRTRFLLGAGVAGSIGEGILGNHLAGKWNYDGGSTSILQMWGDVGTISGLLTAELFDFWNNEELDAVFATSLLLNTGGLVAGKYFGDSRNYTLGDAIVYRSTILLSCFLPVTLVHYFEPDEFTAYAAAGLAGIAAGSYTGWLATRDRDFDTNESVFITLGEITGALLGLGAGYLIAPDDSNGKLILTTTTLGAFAGYGIMYSQFKDRALKLSSKINMDLGINPLGLLLNQVEMPGPEYSSAYSLVNFKMNF